MSQRHPFSTVCFTWNNRFRSDFLRSFMQFQDHNITSDKWSDQNNERFYHMKRFIVCYDIDNVHIEVISIQKLINIDCQKLVDKHGAPMLVGHRAKFCPLCPCVKTKYIYNTVGTVPTFNRKIVEILSFSVRHLLSITFHINI
jgi:hypothetical protein